MSDETQLKPCPHCGNDGSGPIEDALQICETDMEGQWKSPMAYSVQCDKCSATMGYSESEEEAVEAWNNRAPTFETWAEMGDRHALERAEAVMALEAQGLTQTEAAKVLGMSLTQLSNYLTRNDLTWRVVRQGFASRDPESLSPYGVNNPPAGERMQ